MTQHENSPTDSHSRMGRRMFLASSAAMAAAGSLATSADAFGLAQPATKPTRVSQSPGDDHRGICAISSGNGIPAVAMAVEMIQQGADPADAVVRGVNIVEDDPNDLSVGLGGLPNEDGIVELDSSVMHGPTHKAGAVAALRNIRNPASVALKVLRRTDHVMIVGEGALRFARAHGFQEENLLTEKSRQAWLRWKENLNPNDDWLDDDQRDMLEEAGTRTPIPYTWGTIHCSAVTATGDLAGVTTTSGLSYKIPGRVGDSPIVGAGMFVDNFVGAAGATGRGEAVIQNCSAFSVVREMENGLTPTEACLAVLKRMADRTKQKRLLCEDGRPNYNVSLYALRKDGAYGGASMWKGTQFSVHDGQSARHEPSAFLFEKTGR